MKPIKLLSLTLAAALMFGVVLTLPAQSYAATNNSNPFTTLVERIAQKFGLKTQDVQTVADELQNERQQQRTAEMENNLELLVKNGKITAAQKQLLLDKHKELQTEHDKERAEMSGKTFEERKTLMEERRSERQKERIELEAWAKQNGIDAQYLFGNMGLNNGKGMGFGRGMHGMSR